MSYAWRNVAVSLLVLAGSTAALAEPYDMARRRADAARRDYEVAQGNLNSIISNLSQVERRVRDLKSQQSSLPRDIADASERARRLSTDADAAERKIPSIKADVTKAENEHRDLLSVANASKSAMTQAAADVDKAKAEATAAFEASPAWMALADKVARAESAVAAATDAVMASLTLKPDFKALLASATSAESNLKTLRESGRTDSVPAASKAWIDAKNAVEQTKTRALDADAPTIDARKKLSAARQEQAVAKAKFDADLAKVPEVSTAIAQLSTKKKAYDQDAAAAAAADRQANAARQTLASTTRSISTMKEQARAAESEVDRLRREQQSLEGNLQTAERQLSSLQRDERNARSQLANAQRNLNDAIARERQAQIDEQRRVPPKK